MQAITTIGLDIAKSVFQVHGVDAGGNVVFRRQFKRRYVLAFFQKLPSVPGRHRSVRFSASLVARTSGPWAHRAPDAASVREALCEAAQKRCYRRRGDLRSGHQAEHAVRRDQDARATKLPDAAPYPSPVHPPADLGNQCHPCSHGRVR